MRWDESTTHDEVAAIISSLALTKLLKTYIVKNPKSEITS